MTTTSSSGVITTTTLSKISLDKELYKSDFQKPGTVTAQLRQIVTTDSKYPSKKTASNMQANVFDNSEFGFATQDFTSTETRIAWILVPEIISKEEVIKRIEAVNVAGGCIYKALSNKPILDDNQQYAITAGIRTLDDFAITQAVRYPENSETIAAGTAGKLVLDAKGQVQYRRTFFWNAPKADVDERNIGEAYVPAVLKAELAGASTMRNQTL